LLRIKRQIDKVAILGSQAQLAGKESGHNRLGISLFQGSILKTYFRHI
jgi:hypothetical protein